MESALERRTRQITEGSIPRSLFAIAGPIVLANALHTAFQLVNTFWVGRLGANAVAAISVSFPLIFFLIAVGGGLAIAGSVFVAQYAGARRYDEVNHVAGQTIVMVLAASVVLSSIGYVLAAPALDSLGIAPEIHEDAKIYLRVSVLGLVFGYAFMMFQSIMQGVGEVRLPLYLISANVLMNAILDPWLIFGWGPIPPLGVAGAAYATVGTQAVTAIVGMTILFSGRYGIRLDMRNFSPDLPLIKRAMLLGIPASIEQSARSLGMLVITSLAAQFGTLALATYGMGMRVMSIVFIPALGLSMATATLVAQNIGAGNVKRAEDIAKASSKFAFFALSAAVVPLCVFAAPIVRFFVPNDEALVAEGALFVQIVLPTFGLVAAQQVLLGVFRGAGQTMASMSISMVSQWLIQLPLAWALARFSGFGAVSVWCAFPAAALISTAIAIVWFQKGTWREVKLTEARRFKEAVSEKIIIEEGAP